MSRDRRRLRAFELADKLVLAVYRVTVGFPDDEKYGMSSQMRRSAVSVADNIVEGCARPTHKDYVHFLRTAFASHRELGYYIRLADRLQYLSNDDGTNVAEGHEETAIVLNALICSPMSQ